MSHIPQRKEKDCLNCGTIVQGRYCHVCGQENVVPKETFWHMVTHFFYDITHFDSSFFTTAKDLLFKPGFLSREYMIGRRVSYLHPIRMYVFTSAIFFLLFFSFFQPKHAVNNAISKPLTADQRTDQIAEWKDSLQKDPGNKKIMDAIALFEDTSKVVSAKDVLKVDRNQVVINFSDKNYESVGAYDSAQRLKPASKRDNWLERRFVILGINITRQFREDPEGAGDKLLTDFFHRLPYLLFISLPLFALILKLVYIRRRKEYYFADHGVFTIHLYVFTFIVLLLVFLFDELEYLTGWKYFDVLQLLLFILLGIYLYIGMHNFYKQGWFKTFLKFLLVTIFSLAMMGVLFLTLLLFSAATL